MIRIFMAEFELELWLLKAGRFERLATYLICRWSGGLGPKLKEGDRRLVKDSMRSTPRRRTPRAAGTGPSTSAFRMRSTGPMAAPAPS